MNAVPDVPASRAASTAASSDQRRRGDDRPGRRLIALEAVRGLAATYVAVAHGPAAGVPRLRLALSFGQEAVMVFFLLSGFVVYYATCGLPRQHPMRFREYFIRRARRIYPIFLLALVLTYVLRSAADHDWTDWQGRSLLGNLFMLQDVSFLKRGVWVDTYLGTLSLWSLSYEWWFYLAFFPVLRFVGAGRRLLVVGVLSAVGFVSYQLAPNQASLFASYFAIWWTGVEISREYSDTGRVTWRRQLRPVVLLVTLAGLWAVPVAVARAHGRPLNFGVDPVLQLRHFASSAVIVIVGLACYARRTASLDRLFGVVALVAPISYAIYVFHQPIFKYAGNLLPGLPLAAQIVISVSVLLLLSWLAEGVLQPRVNRLTDRLLLHRRPSGRPISDTLTPP